MTSNGVVGMLGQLIERRAQLAADIETRLAAAQRDNREELTAAERRALDDIRALDERIRWQRSECDRMGTSSLSGKITRAANSAGRAAPLHFDDGELRHLHNQVLQQQPGRIEARGFETVTPHLPAELFPIPTFPKHDNRILDRLPGYSLDAPSLEVVQVDSVTGAAAIVAEGAVKPEIVMNVTKLIVVAQKIAAHTGLSWESIQDWDTFTSFVRTELTQQVIDVENHEIVYGDGTTGHLTGLLGASGILVHAASPSTTHFDDIELAIAKLRSGPPLAEPDIAIFNPATWSAVRREKDGQDRYYVAPDPSATEVNSVWGVPVLVTTQVDAGEGILVDTRKFGRVAVREVMALRIGFNNDDFTRNIVRTIAEERLALCVERPAAILHITGLPTA